MNKATRVGIVLVAWMLTGCLGSTVVLHVRADGTGTATARLDVNRAAFQAFWAMRLTDTRSSAIDVLFPLASED